VPSRARLGRQLGWSREEKLAVLGQTAAKSYANFSCLFCLHKFAGHSLIQNDGAVNSNFQFHGRAKDHTLDQGLGGQNGQW
jgi:hypothetical protein